MYTSANGAKEVVVQNLYYGGFLCSISHTFLVFTVVKQSLFDSHHEISSKYVYIYQMTILFASSILISIIYWLFHFNKIYWIYCTDISVQFMKPMLILATRFLMNNHLISGPYLKRHRWLWLWLLQQIQWAFLLSWILCIAEKVHLYGQFHQINIKSQPSRHHLMWRVCGGADFLSNSGT